MNLNNLGLTTRGRRRPETLGWSLVEHDWIGEADLNRALGRQRDRGGRLGTCLLEINAISEPLLLVALSELLGVPKAEASQLDAVPGEIQALLPAEVAVRRRAIPFAASRHRVQIALADPDDLDVQDELSFIIGKSLTVHVATESRVYEALERYYGYECPVRYRRLLTALDTQPEVAETRSDSGPEEGESPASVVARTATDRPSPAVGDTKTPFQPPAEIPDFDETIQRLEHCTNVEEVGETLVEHLSGDFLRVVLLKTVKRQVRGWMGAGAGLDAGRLAKYRVDLELPSIFLNLNQGGQFFLGVLPPMPPHLKLARCWSEEASYPCAVLPIRIRHRALAFIYLDRDCLGLEGVDLDALQQLGEAASTAFGNCIIARKRD